MVTCARMTSFVKSRSKPGSSSGTVIVLMPCVVSTCMPATSGTAGQATPSLQSMCRRDGAR